MDTYKTVKLYSEDTMRTEISTTGSSVPTLQTHLVTELINGQAKLGWQLMFEAGGLLFFKWGVK